MPPRTARGPRRAASPRRSYKAAGAINVVESGALETVERLERLVHQAKAPSTIKSAIRPMEAAEYRLFDQAGQGHWKATKQETTDEKRRKGLRTEPMRATDKLRLSLVTSPAKYAIRRPGRRNTQLTFGSRLVEGVMQERAGRDPLAIDERGHAEITQALATELLK